MYSKDAFLRNGLDFPIVFEQVSLEPEIRRRVVDKFRSLMRPTVVDARHKKRRPGPYSPCILQSSISNSGLLGEMSLGGL